MPLSKIDSDSLNTPLTVTGTLTATTFAGAGTSLTGTAASLTAGNVTTNANLTGDVTSVGNSTTLANTAVSAGSYTYSSITVDSKGRLTAASNGASPSAFPAGTAMTFIQTAAPTGWTKSTTHDNKSLRIVSGTAASGGSVGFTTAFGTPAVTGSVSISGTVGGTALSAAQMPSHSHTVNWSNTGTDGGNTQRFCTGSGLGGTVNTSTAGSSSTHDHSFSGSGSLSSATATINVLYVDAIIATKD